MEIKFNNNERYIRRTSMSIHVIIVPENNSNNNVMADVKSCYQKINVPFDENNKDRAYRVQIWKKKHFVIIVTSLVTVLLKLILCLCIYFKFTKKPLF